MRRTLVLTAATLGTALALAVPASAHVTVNPKEAAQGGYAKLAFRMPNERDNAETVKLEIALPEQPIKSVSLKPLPGWAAVVDKADGAVTRITWTAESGTSVKPGQFQEFEVSLGPLPKVDKLVFKALQTYSSGEVVRWIEEPTGGTEPEHPAPVLRLTASAPDTGGAHGGVAGAGTAGSTSASAAGAAPGVAAGGTRGGGGSAPGTWLGAGGLLLGAAGLAVGLLALRRGRAAA